MNDAVLRESPLDRGGSVTDLREQNLSQVLRVLATHGPMVRAEIAHRCGLKVTALTSLVDELRGRGLVEEIPQPRSKARGRPAHPVALAAEPTCTLAFGCSRNHVVGAIGNLRGDVVAENRWPISGPAGWDRYAPQLDEVLVATVTDAHRRGLRPLSAQFAIPGAVDHDRGRVIRSVLNGWGGVDLRGAAEDMLERAGIGTALVGVDRETNYALLARRESLDRPAEPVVYLGGRNAISGGILDRDGIVHGAGGLAGEFGHLIVDPGGQQCWCGRRGCVETRLGLRYLYAAINGSEPSFDELSERYPAMIDLITKKADAGDATVDAALAEAGRWLGITIDTVASVVNPQVVFVDGYLCRLTEHVEPSLRGYLDSVGSLPSLASLSVVYRPDDADDLSTTGMIIAGRNAILARPSVARKAAA
ncbi:ROK family transcriptional regulator [Gordonia rhizosphera]|uniref:Putative NagC family transcriptional regulator n=1 Tax=Gordonia rhizosphera NBRC 16068 TaxID=1108045 RepID=K6WLP8_9ACTN|nr:ROK family transcriptional regulator [Gordonia rhizosphera]GAB93087.1 putative NagC family transcriptional regulator [Gordonia rhizosphera NBRC 16068]